MFWSLKTAGVGPVGTMQLPERQGRKGRGRCHEGTLQLLGGKGQICCCEGQQWAAQMWPSSILFGHIITAKRHCPAILGNNPLLVVGPQGLICRSKRVIHCSSENTQNRGLCFMFWTPVGQHSVLGGPAKPHCMSSPTSSLDSEHPCPLEDIPPIPVSLVWPSTNTSFWWDQRHVSIVTQKAFLSAVAENWIFSPTTVRLHHSCVCPAWDPQILLSPWVAVSALSACTDFVSLQDLFDVGASSSFSLSRLCIVHRFLQILLQSNVINYILHNVYLLGG